jgi:hypothetical protein
MIWLLDRVYEIRIGLGTIFITEDVVDPTKYMVG